MTAAPKGEKKADAENTDAVANAELAGTTPGAREEAETLPTPIGPNDPVPEGKVETTVLAKDDEFSDPAGRVTEQKKATRTVTRKSDPFQEGDRSRQAASVRRHRTGDWNGGVLRGPCCSLPVASRLGW